MIRDDRCINVALVVLECEGAGRVLGVGNMVKRWI